MSLVAFNTDDAVHVLDSETHELKIILKGIDTTVTSLCFNRGGDLLAAAKCYFHNGPTIVWEVNSGQQILNLDKSLQISIVSFNIEGNQLLCRCYGGKIMLWSILENVMLYSITECPTESAIFPPICYTRNDQFICYSVLEAEIQLRLFDGISGCELQCLTRVGHDALIRCFAVNTVANLFATGGNDGNVIVWDMEKWTISTELRQLGSPIRQLAYTPDGAKLTVSLQQDICIFDSISNEPLQRFSVGNAVRSMALDSTGSRLVVGFEYVKVTKVFDLMSGVEIASWDSVKNSQVCYSHPSVILM